MKRVPPAVKSFGVYDWGLMARSTKGAVKKLPEFVDLDAASVVQVAAGYGSSYAVMKNGSVVHWGDSAFLGRQSKPEVVSLLEHLKVKCVSAGRSHLLALVKDEVFAIGADKLGVAGNGQFFFFFLFSTLVLLIRHKGGEISMNDQLNGAADGMFLKFASRVPIPVAVRDIARGAFDHCVALSEDGDVFTWGFNMEG
jgi:alpha-tubulin suppressor-like RCC1 family protein